MSDKPTKREQLQAMSDRVHAARMNAEEFIDAGGDLNSKEALLIGVELALAANALSTEFGYSFLKKLT